MDPEANDPLAALPMSDAAEASTEEALVETAHVELAPVELASIGDRFVAMFLDGLLLAAAGYLINLASGLNESAFWAILWMLASLLIPAVYYIWPYSTSGRTAGKRRKEIRVAAADGSPLNWRKGIIRYFAMALSTLPFGLGYLWAIWDGDKQTWHDKLAGTVVVEDSPGQRQSRLSTEESNRRQRRWWLALGLPFLLIICGAMAWFVGITFVGGTREAAELGPWPGRTHDPEELLPGDLSTIGLGPAIFHDAKSEESPWSELTYQRGTVAEYRAGARTAVLIAALKHRNVLAAEEAFQGIAGWAEEGGCGSYRWTNLGSTGYLECRFNDSTGKLYQNGPWIVHIMVFEDAPEPFETYVDEVRDALAAHWETLD